MANRALKGLMGARRPGPGTRTGQRARILPAMRRIACICLLLLAACEPAAEPVPLGPAPTPPFDQSPRLVSALDVVQVTLSQAVEIQLISGDEALDPEDRRSPIVAGRPALVRVYVQAVEGWTPRDVTATLRLVALPGGGELERFEATQFVQTTSTAADPESTFDFELPAESMIADLAWSVELREVDLQTYAGEGARAAFPRPDGDQLPDHEALWVDTWGSTVRLHIIPVRYNHDGSGRLPDLTDEQKAIYETAMRGMYPVSDLLIEYGEPWDTDVEFDNDGSGFGDVLEAMRTVRVEREVPWNRYVYALVQPRDSFQTFCATGCTLGLSYRVANPAQANLRVSVGAGFPGDSAGWTLAHEIGHAHDRGHAPCGGASNVDAQFPYPDGGTGVWGWNSITGERYSPDESSDVMGYCQGKWVSDYQYRELAERIAFFEGIEEPADDGGDSAGVPEGWVRVGVRAGQLDSPVPEDLMGEPGGEPVDVEVLDANGLVLRTVTGHLARFAHGDDGTLLLATPAPDAVSLRFDGRVTPL